MVYIIVLLKIPLHIIVPREFYCADLKNQWSSTSCGRNASIAVDVGTLELECGSTLVL